MHFINKHLMLPTTACKNFLLLLLVLNVGMSFGQQSVMRTITVGPALAHQNYEHFKRLVLSSDNSNVEYIDGFAFEWGYQYTLQVRETKLPAGLSDGTQYEYELEKILEKKQVPDSTTFRLFVDPLRYYYYDEEDPEMNNTFSIVDDSTYLYMEEVYIEVPEHLRNAYAQLVAGTTGRNGTYQFIDARRIRLVALL